jgi:predicted Fe-Mo cluster-binding NifX family protein
MRDTGKEDTMRVAVPVEGGSLASHFGHCSTFEVFEIDSERRSIGRSEIVEAPPHEPGRLPRWLSELGVQVVLAGGMGRRAQELFRTSGITVVVGVAGGAARLVVQSYLDGALETGENPCDH